MRDSDIRAGVIFGVAPRWREDPQPVVVLQDKPRSIFTLGPRGLVAVTQPDARLSVGRVPGREGTSPARQRPCMGLTAPPSSAGCGKAWTRRGPGWNGR